MAAMQKNAALVMVFRSVMRASNVQSQAKSLAWELALYGMFAKS
jgi:hypothetical protein